MRYIQLTLTIITALLSLHGHATSLVIAKAFNIKAVNGTAYSAGIVSQDRLLELRDGKNLIAIEYEEVFDSDDGENFDIIKSTPFLLDVYLQKDKIYQQKIVKPANAAAARKFAQSPLFEIVSQQPNQPVHRAEFKLTALVSDSISYLLQQTQLTKSNTLLLTHPNSTNQKQIQTDINLPSDNSAQSMPLKMLHYWWIQATDEEKKQFLNSVK